MSINKVILVGNVGKDPVVRYFEKGVAKATFPLATSESYTNQQGETITATEWHNIVLWRALAEVAEKTIKKGAQVYVVGKIKTRSYVDKDGNNKYITEILADTILLLDKKPGQGTYTGQSDSKQNVVAEKSRDASEVNDPGTSYQTSPEKTKKEWDNQNMANDDGSGPEEPLGNGSGPEQSEDDLPF
jgi:single-strand DNA-binding protein